MQVLDSIRLIPRKTVSWIIGRLARQTCPAVLVHACIRRFIKAYSVDTTELDRPLEAFSSVAEFFSRPLKEGARPVGDGVVSPADGVVTMCGAIEGGKIPQVKGLTYDVADLVGDTELARPFVNGGTFVTIYLAPPDYHRIHAPCAGKIQAFTFVPGTLWPVNDWSVQAIPQVFTRNERVTTVIDGSIGTVGVVKVGALNVGSISLSYDPFLTNHSFPLFASPRPVVKRFDSVKTEKGGELGRFQLGSTVVLLFERDAVELSPDLLGKRVRCGETIAGFRK